ncbi:MAG: hypothetical protein ACOC33_02760 [bacterium]
MNTKILKKISKKLKYEKKRGYYYLYRKNTEDWFLVKKTKSLKEFLIYKRVNTMVVLEKLNYHKILYKRQAKRSSK